MCATVASFDNDAFQCLEQNMLSVKNIQQSKRDLRDDLKKIRLVSCCCVDVFFWKTCAFPWSKVPKGSMYGIFTIIYLHLPSSPPVMPMDPMDYVSHHIRTLGQVMFCFVWSFRSCFYFNDSVGFFCMSSFEMVGFTFKGQGGVVSPTYVYPWYLAGVLGWDSWGL